MAKMREKEKKPPMGNPPEGMSPKAQFEVKTLGRLLSYMKDYRGQLVFVVISILLSAIASAVSSLFLQTLIDDYIVPLLGTSSPVFSELLKALVIIGAVYLIGVLSTLFYNRVMVTIAQGTLQKIRDDMFEKMQRLPIRVFDTRTHGDIMSLYTNDTDTLRQMIAQSMAQLISSVFTIVAVFVCMLYISVWLTLVAVAVMLLILQIVKMITGKIGVFFMMQQKTLADVNGYVEEMVNGQKVIKVFCHEEKAKEELREKNRAWAMSAASANGYANSMMPMMNALGYVQYVIIAILGAYMAISGMTNLGFTGTGTLTLGMIASFLTLSRSFTNPVSQISNQFNSIVVALAGASCIFAFMDEEPETDEGYVTLVNADGFIRMLPQGYHTVLKGDSSGLSQGQRQLISIARAAVSNPPVMILDEATSSIDTRTEALVQDGMDKLIKGRTVFVIAHRLSTVQNSDVIMVLDHGRIIERGNHAKLIADKGTYYQLYTGAFELE